MDTDLNTQKNNIEVENESPVKLDINDESVIRFLKLFKRKETNSSYYYTNEATGVSMFVDEVEMINLFDYFDGERNIKEIIDIYGELNNLSKERKRSLTLELEYFISQCLKLGLVAKINGIPVARNIIQEKKDYKILRKFGFLFSIPTLIIFSIIILIGIILLFSKPEYLPSYKDFFWHKNIVLNLIINLLVGWFFVMIHEIFHLAFSVINGGESTIKFGRRALTLSALVKLKNLYKLPQRLRLGVLLAGILFQGFVIGVILIVKYLSDLEILSLQEGLSGFLNLILLSQISSFLWQFQLFMPGDLYLVATDISKIHNLLFLTKLYFKSIVYTITYKIFKREKYLYENISKFINYLRRRTRRIAKIYFFMIVLSIFIVLFRYAYYIIPIHIKSISIIYTLLKEGLRQGSFLFLLNGIVGSIVYFILYLFPYLFFIRQKAKSTNPLIHIHQYYPIE